MESIYLTRHGRTYINELWGSLNQDQKDHLQRNPQVGITRDRLAELISDENQRRDFVLKNGIQDGDYPIFPFSVSKIGYEQAEALGMYLEPRKDIQRIVVPTKGLRRIFRNERSGERIQDGMGRRLEGYNPDSFTEEFGEHFIYDELFNSILRQIAGLSGHLFVLNSGILERIVNACGGNLEYFDNCGLVILGTDNGRLTIVQDYLSNDEIKERL